LICSFILFWNKCIFERTELICTPNILLFILLYYYLYYYTIYTYTHTRARTYTFNTKLKYHLSCVPKVGKFQKSVTSSKVIIKIFVKKLKISIFENSNWYFDLINSLRSWHKWKYVKAQKFLLTLRSLMAQIKSRIKIRFTAFESVNLYL